MICLDSILLNCVSDFSVRSTKLLQIPIQLVITLLNLFVGLPKSGSWQDLKDHMREAGDVCYADVYKDGTGVVEFLRYEDMKYAARKLDDTKFRSHEVCLKKLCKCKRSLNFYFGNTTKG